MDAHPNTEILSAYIYLLPCFIRSIGECFFSDILIPLRRYGREHSASKKEDDVQRIQESDRWCGIRSQTLEYFVFLTHLRLGRQKLAQI
jgi:hypothetical protein